jgi:hypothetical protein
MVVFSVFWPHMQPSNTKNNHKTNPLEQLP